MQSQFFPNLSDKSDLQKANTLFYESIKTILSITDRLSANYDPNDPVLIQSFMIADEIKRSVILSNFVKPQGNHYSIVSSPTVSSKSFDKQDVTAMLPTQLMESLTFNPITQQQQQQQQQHSNEPHQIQQFLQPSSQNQISSPLHQQQIQQQQQQNKLSEQQFLSDDYAAYEKYERIAKQDIIQHLKLPIQYKEINIGGLTDYTYQVLDVEGNLLGEHTGTKKRAKTFAAIKACRNKNIIPLVIPSKRQYWIETYFPNLTVDISINSDEQFNDTTDLLDARNKLYSFYNRTFNTVPQYEFTQDQNLYFYCDLYIMGILKAKGEGRSKKLAANDAAKKVLKNEKIV